MKHLFEPAAATDITSRLAQLTPQNERQWGRMDLPQVLAHCAAGLELARGDIRPPRVFIGRVLGWAIKPLALGDDAPMRRNSPTVDSLLSTEQPDFESARTRLATTLDRFVAGGPQGCTTHPHPFFGRLTSQEWAILMYKHLDHHLRQFGA